MLSYPFPLCADPLNKPVIIHPFPYLVPATNCIRTLQVSIVAMSGAVCEAQAYESATGGAADFDNLGQIMNQTNPPMDSKAQQAQARQGGGISR